MKSDGHYAYRLFCDICLQHSERTHGTQTACQSLEVTTVPVQTQQGISSEQESLGERISTDPLRQRAKPETLVQGSGAKPKKDKKQKKEKKEKRSKACSSLQEYSAWLISWHEFTSYAA